MEPGRSLKRGLQRDCNRIRFIGEKRRLPAELPAPQKQTKAVCAVPVTGTKVGRAEELSEHRRLIVAYLLQEQVVEWEGEDVSERDVESRWRARCCRDNVEGVGKSRRCDHCHSERRCRYVQIVLVGRALTSCTSVRRVIG